MTIIIAYRIVKLIVDVFHSLFANCYGDLKFLNVIYSLFPDVVLEYAFSFDESIFVSEVFLFSLVSTIVSKVKALWKERINNYCVPPN